MKDSHWEVWLWWLRFVCETVGVEDDEEGEALWEEVGGIVNDVIMNWGGDAVGVGLVVLEVGVIIVGLGVDIIVFGVGVIKLGDGVTISVGCREILLEFEIMGVEIDDCSPE